MRTRLLTILVVGFCAAVCTSAGWAQGGKLSEYYTDWADAKLGATITSPSKIQPDFKLDNIIIPSKEQFCVFADGIEQREEFTIDLGQERKLGFFIFEMTNTIVYGGEVNRKPNSLTVEISNQSKDGPWTQVYKQDPADVVMSFALEGVPARWIHFDLGVNKDGVGSRVRKAKIYPRYQLKSGPELMKEFHKQFRRDAEGLGDFWKAVDSQKWEDACDLLIDHYSHWPPEQKGEPSPRVAAWMNNEVSAGGCVYKYDSTDWDWYRLRTECARQAQGEPPGASTILQLIKTAYAVTGDEAYAKQLAGLLRDWLQDLPCTRVHRGQDDLVIIPWSGIIASQRTWSFGEMVHAMFPEKQYFDRDLKINLLYSLWEHINYLKAIFPDLGGNWLTNANSCMFTAAKDYPEFVQFKEWMESSESFFEASLLRDFLTCGRPSEDSMMYVPIATGQIMGQYTAMKKAGVAISPEAQKKIETLYNCPSRVSYPDLSCPAIGDMHRASPLISNGQAVLQSYLDLFDRPDLVFINTQGKKGRVPEPASSGCKDCGWYTMRSPWNTTPYADARQMFFKATAHPGHGHPDQLSFTMYAYGREVLTDPGNPRYGLPIEPAVRKTAVHNTICMDERDQSGCYGSQNAWTAGTGADYVDAQCAPYRTMVQRRQVVFLKSGNGRPDYWLIHDSMTGEGRHRFDLNFHFSEGANPIVTGNAVCSTYAEGGNALLQVLDPTVKPEIIDSSIALLDSLVPSKVVRYRKAQAAPVAFDTLVLPYKGAKAPAASVIPLAMDTESADKDAVAFKVSIGGDSDIVIISSKPGSKLSIDKGKIKTDASALVIRTNKRGKVIYAFQSGGTGAEYRGKELLKTGGADHAEKLSGTQ